MKGLYPARAKETLTDTRMQAMKSAVNRPPG
jgi:hypothetical protein